MAKRFCSTLVFFCVMLVVAMAQKPATVKSFTATADHIPGKERRKDYSGVQCALVKVQVVDDITRVEGNKIGDIVNKGVEKWIYMCKGSRNVRIHLKNHLPVKVMFQDYKINGLESNRVYELVLEIPDAPAPTVAPIVQQQARSETTQTLTIKFKPTNATVLVDSKPYQGDGKVEMSLPVGEHSYMIAAVGYITAEGTVKLNEYAPRTIEENLSRDETYKGNENIEENQSFFEKTAGNVGGFFKGLVGGGKDKKAKPEKKKSDKKKTKAVESTTVSEQQASSSASTISKPKKRGASVPTMDDILGRTNDSAEIPVVTTPPDNLNKSFKSQYQGVTFNCKAKNGYVTVTGFETGAISVTIPAQVSYEGRYYPVTTIDTNINGNNYSAERLVISDGIQIIEKYSFAEFRKLKEVVLPNSIKEIGKKAFRNNKQTKFTLPGFIRETQLRNGVTIKITHINN